MGKHGIQTRPRTGDVSDRVIVDYLSRRGYVHAWDYEEGDPFPVDFQNDFGITFRQFMTVHLRLAIEQGRWDFQTGPPPRKPNK